MYLKNRTLELRVSNEYKNAKIFNDCNLIGR